MSVGKRLREWRKNNCLKTTEISETTGISTGALSNYENDKREISSNFLLKLEEIYDADIYYILTGVKSQTLSEDEKQLINCYRILPENEKNRFLGRIEEIAERHKGQTEKLSEFKTG